MNGYLQKYEAIIGLEVHVELKTERKIFCSCESKFGGEPNTRVCPICYGMPGALPVLSDEAVELAVRAGIVLGCRINRESSFDRKNYYYPDLPKGYQITQYRTPICVGGAVPIETASGKRSIGLQRIHLEEDAGKLIHRGEHTLVDYNRCGVPLIEIVSLPEMRTPDEAKAYLDSLRRLLSYSDVSDCKMNEGSLRCDVNVSVRRRGEIEYGNRCELKNLNSVNFVGRALEYEIKRQCAILDEGGTVECETRRYNEDSGVTERMRSKETATDYRYIAEPNIPVLVLADAYVEKVKMRMPKSAEEISHALMSEYCVKATDAELLTRSYSVARYFMRCAECTEYKTLCANLFISEVAPKLDDEQAGEYISAENLGEICNLFGRGSVTSVTAKKLVHMSAVSGEAPISIAERENLLKITDPAEIARYAEAAVAANDRAVSDYLRGKLTVIKQFVGAVMRATGGRADPVIAEVEIKRALDKRVK